MTTRYGFANAKARKSIFWLKSTTKRVCASSPASRISLAIGKSLAMRDGGAGATAGSPAQAPPRTIVPNTIARLAARTDMECASPLGALLAHYGRTVNPDLNGNFVGQRAGERRSEPAGSTARSPWSTPCHWQKPALIRGADGLQFRLYRVWISGASAQVTPLIRAGGNPRNRHGLQHPPRCGAADR